MKAVTPTTRAIEKKKSCRTKKTKGPFPSPSNAISMENIMNRKELVEAIINNKELSHLTKKDADAFVGCLLDTIKKTVKKGEDVSLIGFGTFCKTRRAARTGVNASTGERIKIKARTLPKFRPGKAWKEMM